MEAESRRINRVFSMEPLTVYTQWKGNTMTMKTDMPRLETEQLIRKEASHNTDAKMVGRLKNRLQQPPKEKTLTEADVQEKV